MQNVSVETKGNKVIITIDASKEVGPSASGKNTVVATTKGNQPIAVNGQVMKLGLNLFKK